MPPPGQAVAAPSTNDMAFAADDVAGKEVADIRSHRNNFADKFVPNRHRNRDRLLRPIVPLINMDVGSADAGVSHTDQDIIDTADFGFWYLFKPKSRLRLTSLTSAFQYPALRNICGECIGTQTAFVKGAEDKMLFRIHH